MATVSYLGKTVDTNAGQKTFTATPAVDDLPVIILFWSGSSGADIGSNQPTDTNSDGNGTYTFIAACEGNGGTVRAALFIRDHKIGSATSTDFKSPTAPTNNGGGLAVYVAVGMTNVGAAAARQSGSDDGESSGTTPVVAYSPSGAALTANAQIGALITNGSTPNVTAPTGFTRDLNTNYTTPSTGYSSYHINSGDTSANLTWGSTVGAQFGALAVELATGAAPPVNTVAPAVTGTATVGSTLTTTLGTWTDDAGSTVKTREWQRDNHGGGTFSALGASGSTYVLADADDGCQVRCRVIDTDNNGTTSAVSNAVSVTRPAPTTSSAQPVSGGVNVGNVLTVTPTGWTNMLGYNASYTYQWQDSANGSTGWADIGGATSVTYAIVSGENTKYLRCNVTAHNTGGTGLHVSDVVGPVTAIPPINNYAPEIRTGNPRYNLTMPRVIWDGTAVVAGALYATTLGSVDGVNSERIYKFADPTLPSYTSAQLESSLFQGNNALIYDSVNNCLYAGINTTGGSGTYRLTIYKISLDLATITKIVDAVLVSSLTGSLGGNVGLATDGTHIYALPNTTTINSIVYKFACSNGALVSEYQIPSIGSDATVGASQVTLSGSYLYVSGAPFNRSNPPYVARIPLSTFNTSTAVQLTGFDFIGDDVLVAFGSLWFFDEETTLHPNGRFAKVALDLSSVTYVDTDVVGRGLDGLTSDGTNVWVSHRSGDGLVYAYNPTSLTHVDTFSLQSGEGDINDFYPTTGGFVSVLTLPSPTRVVYQPLPVVPPSNRAVGDVLTCSPGTWTDDHAPTITYQWQRDVGGNGSYSNLGGATTNQRTLVTADLSCHVRCRVTNTDVNGPTTASSNTVLVGQVTLSDTGLSVGDSLVTKRPRALADTGLSISSVLVSTRVRPLSSAGLSIGDSLVAVSDFPTTLALLGSSIDTNATAKTVTATPAVDDLPIIVEFWSGGGAIGTNKPTDTNADGLGTYTFIGTADGNGGNVRAAIFIRDHKIGSATSTNFTTALPTNNGCGLSVYVATGMVNVGAAAARQIAQNDGAQGGNTPTAQYQLAARSANAQIAAIINGSNPAGVTAPTGFTRGVHTGYNTPTTGCAVYTIDSGDASTTLTWGNTSATNFCVLAVELSTGGPPPANTAAPAVTGSAVVGSTLSCSTGTWTDDVSHVFTRQWYRDNHGGGTFGPIGGATGSTYLLDFADDGCQVRCVVTDTDNNGATSATSNAVAVVEPVPTTSTNQPVTGWANVGSTLTGAASGDWTNMGYQSSFTYQWQDSANGSTGWADISGATSPTYKIAAGENTKYLRLQVTAHNTGGTGTHASAVQGPVTALPAVNTIAPEIRIGNPRYSLLLGRTIWDGTAMVSGALYAVTRGDYDGINDEYVYKWADATLPAYTRVLQESHSVPDNETIVFDAVNNCYYAGPYIRVSGGSDFVTVYKVAPDLSSVTKIVNDVLLTGATTALSVASSMTTDGTYIYVLPSFISQNAIVYRYLCSTGAFDAQYTIPNIGSSATRSPTLLLYNSGYVYAIGGPLDKFNPPFVARIPVAGFNSSTTVQLTQMDYPADDAIIAFGSLWVIDEFIDTHTNGRFAKVALDLSTVTYYDTDLNRGLDGIASDGTNVLINHRQGDGLVYAINPASGTKVTQYAFRSTEAAINDLYSVPSGLVAVTIPPTRIIYQPLPVTPSPYALVGNTLSSSAGDWDDDGAPTITYQWQRDNSGGGSYSNIGSATGVYYTLTSGDVGCHIRCRVTNTDANGATNTNSNTIQVPTRTLTDTGLTIGDSLLVQRARKITDAGLSIADSLVSKRTRLLTAVGLTLSDSLVKLGGSPPANTVAPAVTGSAVTGQTLTCSTGTWTQEGTPVYTYQWKNEFADIGGATSNTLLVTSSQDGRLLSCTVTNTDAVGATSATSNVVGPVVMGSPPVSTAPPPDYTARRAQVGFVVSAHEGNWANEGGSSVRADQWQLSPDGTTGWANIGGETTLNYLLVPGDLGKYIRFRVTNTNAAGSTTVYSPVLRVLGTTNWQFLFEFGSFSGSADTEDAGTFTHNLSSISVNPQDSNSIWTGIDDADLVRKFSSNGTYVTSLWYPSFPFRAETGDVFDVACSPVNGDVVCAVNGHSWVTRFTKNAVFVNHLGSNGTGNGQFREPSTVGFFSDGSILIGERQGNRIQKLSATLVFQSIWKTGYANFAIAPDDTVWLSDGKHVASDGSLIADYGPTVLGEIAIDNESPYHIYDHILDYIVVYDQTLTVIDYIGTPGSGVGQMLTARNMDVRDKKLYVADKERARVLVFTSAGAARNLFDTGLAVSDSLVRLQLTKRPFTDTGLSLADALKAVPQRKLVDTGLAVSDGLVRSLPAFRTLTDTALTVGDSLSATKIPGAPPAFIRSFTDTGLAVSDALFRVARFFRTTDDTGVSISDVLVAVGGHPSPPQNTVAPVITGTTTVGQTLTCDQGTWGDIGGVKTFQWRRDVLGNGVYSNIAGATAPSYVLITVDGGCHIRCVVTDTDANGATAATSNTVGPVNLLVSAPAIRPPRTAAALQDLPVLTQKILGALPPWYLADVIVQSIIDAVAGEAKRLEDYLVDVRKQVRPQNADDTYGLLGMWEALFSLPVRPAGVSLADRRSLVLGHYRKRQGGSGADWEAAVSEAMHSTSWSYTEGPAANTVTVRFPYVVGGYTTAQALVLIKEITPAHLVLAVGYSSGWLLGISNVGDVL